MKTSYTTLCVAVALLLTSAIVKADSTPVLDLKVETKGNDLEYWSVANITPDEYINVGNNRTQFDKSYLENATSSQFYTAKSLEQTDNGWAWNKNSGWISSTDSDASEIGRAHV